MLTSEIPQRIDVRCPPFTGIYDKKAMADRTLFCWFNNEDPDNFPHVSVHMTTIAPEWKEFHVTFPVQHKGGWDAEASKRSFSLYFRINGGKIELYDENSGGIRRDTNDPNPMTFGEMANLGKVFALRFVQAAMLQSYGRGHFHEV
jgi:hypothetical protein